MKRLGLIGFPLDHSFSQRYFTDKFSRELVTGYRYDLFPLTTIEELPALLNSHPDLIGLNVTIPFKEAVLDFLDETDKHATSIGAVNTIVIHDHQLRGYNTDWLGFCDSLVDLDPSIEKAIILGSGGASKAVKYALSTLGIASTIVSRQRHQIALSYDQLSEKIIRDHRLIINCTPLGTFPRMHEFPPLPYEALTNDHFLYDLVYNPEETIFMQKGRAAGAQIKNGYDMLVSQAEHSWRLWHRF